MRLSINQLRTIFKNLSVEDQSKPIEKVLSLQANKPLLGCVKKRDIRDSDPAVKLRYEILDALKSGFIDGDVKNPERVSFMSKDEDVIEHLRQLDAKFLPENVLTDKSKKNRKIEPKSLLVREVVQIIDDSDSKIMAAELRYFKKSHPELVKRLDGLSKDALLMLDRPELAADIRDNLLQVQDYFRTSINDLLKGKYRDVKEFESDPQSGIKVFYETTIAALSKLLDEGAAKLFVHDRSAALQQFQKDADELIDGFGAVWRENFEKNEYITEDDRLAAEGVLKNEIRTFVEMKDAARTDVTHAVAPEKLTAFKAELASFLGEMRARVGDQLDAAEKTIEGRVALTEAARIAEKVCRGACENLSGCLAEETEAFEARWRGAYGMYCDDELKAASDEVGKLNADCQKQAQQMLDDVLKTLAEVETRVKGGVGQLSSEAVKKTIADTQNAFVEKFREMHEGFKGELNVLFVQAEDAYQKNLKDRQVQRFVQLADEALGAFKQAVEQHRDAFSDEPQRANFIASKEEAVRQMKSNITPLNMKRCFDDVIKTLNEGYSQITTDKIDLMKSAFDRSITDAEGAFGKTVDVLSANVKTAVSKLLGPAAGERVIQELRRKIEQERKSVRDSFYADFDIQSGNPPDVKERFDEATRRILDLVGDVMKKVDRQKGNPFVAKPKCEEALKKLGEVKRRFLETAEMLRRQEGPGSAVAAHYLRSRILQLDRLLAGAAKLAASDVSLCSADALKVAIDRMHAYADKVMSAIMRWNDGEATETLVASLQSIVTPEIHVWSFFQEIEDAPLPVLSALAKQKIRGADNGLGLLKKELEATLREFNQPEDADARRHLTMLATEVLTKVTQALNRAADEGFDTGKGVAGILRKAWSEVAQLTIRLKSEKMLAALAEQLKQAQQRFAELVNLPNAKKTILDQRKASLQSAQITLNQFASAVNVAMDKLAREQKLPKADQWKNMLASFKDSFERYQQQFAGTKKKSFEPLSIQGLKALQEVTLVADETDPLAAAAQGDYASLEDLNQAIEDVKEKKLADNAKMRADSWDAYVLAATSATDQENIERIDQAERKAAEILKAPSRTFAEGDARGDELMKKIESDNRQLQEAQEKAEQLRREQRANSLQAKRLEQIRKAEAARAADEERAKAFADFESEFGKDIERYSKTLMAHLSEQFINCPNIDRYMLRDDDGNFAGWTRDGENIICAVLDRQLQTVRQTAFKNYCAYVRDKKKGQIGELVSFSDVESVKCLTEERGLYEARFGLAPNQSGGSGPVAYPRGIHLFGLDVDKLTDEQRKGLVQLLKLSFIDKNDEELINMAKETRHMALTSLDMVYCQVEHALHDGRLRLEDLTTDFCGMITSAQAGARIGKKQQSCGQFTSIADTYFGETDFMVLYDLIRKAGVTPQMIEGWSPGRIHCHLKLISILHAYNSNSMEGLEAVSQRLFGRSTTMASKILENTADPDNQLLFARYQALVKAADQRTSAGWRSIEDPYVRMKPMERQVVGMVRMEYDYRSEDADCLKVFRSGLSELAMKNEGETVTLSLGRKYGNTKTSATLVLTRGKGDSFSAAVKVAQSYYETKKDGEVELKYNEKDPQEFPIDVPVTLTMVRDQLDRVILAQVGTYGLDVALGILNARRGAVGSEVFDQSSEARQMALAILKGYAGVDATYLSVVSTSKLVSLVANDLAPDGPYGDLAKMSPAERGQAIRDRLPVDPLAQHQLNSQVTLDIYSRYQNASPAEKQTVVMPDPPPVRVGETLNAARVRRMHAFVSELIQPSDTTKFDLDLKRHDGQRQKILRETLVANMKTLDELMRMDDQEIFDLFTLQGQSGTRLDGFAEAVVNLVKSLREIRGADTPENAKAFHVKLTSDLDSETSMVIETAMKALSRSSKATLEHLQTAFVSLFSEAFGQLSKTNADPVWKKSLDELSKTVTVDPNKGYGLFLKQVLGSYFTRMGDVDRDRMTALVMRYSTSSGTLGQTLGALLKGSGPILQKLMQGLPQSALPKELQEAVEDLKSNLAPIPEEAVRAYLYDAIAGSKGEITGITVRKSLGAASVGQAFFCQVKTKSHPEGEDCVIKILRPDVQSRALREKAFFQDMIDETGTGDMLNARFDSIFDEFDLSIEAANVASGSVYDPDINMNGSPRVRSMKLHPAGPVTSNMLFLKCAPGETYDRFLARMRQEKERLLSHLERKVVDGRLVYGPKDIYSLRNAYVGSFKLLAELTERQRDLADFVAQWTEEVAFGDGFFHGDVHAGNIMTSPTGLTVIDFGNASRFTEKEREGILQMLIQSTFNKPEKFLEHFKGLLSGKGQKQLNKLLAKKIVEDLGTIFSKGGRADAGKRFIAGLQYLQNCGIELPGPLFNLMECMRRLDESVSSLAAEVDSLREIILSIDRSKPDKSVYPNGLPTPYWFDKVSGKDTSGIEEFIQSELMAACQSRQKFEAKIADVRCLLMRADLVSETDFKFYLQDALALAENDPDFFNPDLPEADRTKKHAIFASRVGKILAAIKQEGAVDISMGDALDRIKIIGVADDFASAVGTAVSRHIGAVKSAVGIVTGVKMFLAGELDSDPNEDAYDERLRWFDDYVKKTGSLSMTEPEKKFLRSFGLYFRTPADFGNTLSNPKWSHSPETRQKVLDVFRHTLSQMTNQLSETNLATGSKNPQELYARYLGAMFFARFKDSGFGLSLSKEKFQSLLKDAAQDRNLVEFLRSLRTISLQKQG